MSRIEAEFRRETPARSLAAPIAQVAAETAAAYQPGNAEERALQARDETDAASFRKAMQDGLIIREIAIDDIDHSSIPRDRTILEPEPMRELEHSIEEHGQRLPIEIFPLSEPGAAKPYGLLSGYRRLLAQRNVYHRTQNPAFKTINAVLRDPEQMGGAFVAMVEENEIRQNLSHYERGRIAVIAAQRGAFSSTEAAVNEMFGAASKAKRSKIRSFAMIFEELGDLMGFAEQLKERDGLRVAQGLKAGAGRALREALSEGGAMDPKTEWRILEEALNAFQHGRTGEPQMGRPRTASAPRREMAAIIMNDLTRITCHETSGGFQITVRGPSASDELAQEAVQMIRDRLSG
jgi:ParB family chromosome partitioning protein